MTFSLMVFVSVCLVSGVGVIITTTMVLYELSKERLTFKKLLDIFAKLPDAR